MESKGKETIRAQDFNLSCVWYGDEDTNLYYPIRSFTELPANARERDVLIKAIFHTPCGVILNGYIGGINRTFAIGLFANNKIFHFNYNLFSLGCEQFEKLCKELPPGTFKNIHDAFPVRFETQYDFESYRNFTGTFDLFKKQKNPDTKK